MSQSSINDDAYVAFRDGYLALTNGTTNPRDEESVRKRWEEMNSTWQRDFGPGSFSVCQCYGAGPGEPWENPYCDQCEGWNVVWHRSA